MNPHDDQHVPAGPEEFQRLMERFTPMLSNLLKNISEGVGHLLLEQKDTIYQYTSVSGMRGMIDKNELWTTPVGYLNDISEYHHGLNQFLELTEEFIAHPDDGDWKEVLRLLLPRLKQTDPHNVFVTCFTPHDDQLSQWRGYAADGYGYAVGFATASFMDIMPVPMVLNVLYQKDKQQRFCEELLRQGTIEIAHLLKDAGIKPSPEAIAELLSFAIGIMLPGLKHEGFAEESEVRLFLVTDYDTESIKSLLYHERKGLLIPHIPLRWKDGKLPIREIIVGPNLDFEQARWSLLHFLHQRGYMDIEIKRSAIPYLA